MKPLKYAFVFFTLAIVGFYGYLLSLNADSNLSAELNTEIPVPVAFKQLILTTTHQPYVTPQALDSVRLDLVYFKDTQPLKVTYRPVAHFERYELELLPVDSSVSIQPFKRVTHVIMLQKLVDGSTNIRWELHYRMPGLFPRFLNRLFWKPRLQAFLSRKISELKAFYH